MPVRSLLKSRITALNRDMRDLPRALIGDKRHGQVGPKGLPYPPPTMLALGALAPRGACLYTALIDNATKKLYVANLGDCRVVGGWYDPIRDSWRCEIMSQIGDHGAKDPLEEAR